MLHIYEIFYEILFFLSFLGLIIGLLDPSLVVPWGNTKTRLRAILIYGTASLIFLILISVVVSIKTDSRKMLIIKSKGMLTEANIINREEYT